MSKRTVEPISFELPKTAQKRLEKYANAARTRPNVWCRQVVLEAIRELDRRFSRR